MTFKPTLADMAEAVSAVAVEHLEMVSDLDAGWMIGPSERDLASGAVDIRKRALCIAAAADELRAIARLMKANSNRRAAG